MDCNNKLIRKQNYGFRIFTLFELELEVFFLYLLFSNIPNFRLLFYLRTNIGDGSPFKVNSVCK